MNSMSGLSKPETSYSRALKEYVNRNIDPRYLDIFSSRIFSILTSLAHLPKSSKLPLTSPLTESNLKTAFLHYLLKDASYQGANFPLSPIGIFKAKSAGYVRTFGNGLHRTEEFLLQETESKFFNKTPNELFLSSFLVKSLKFKRLLKGEFEWTPVYPNKSRISDSFNERLKELYSYLKTFSSKSNSSPLIDVGQVINPEVDQVEGEELMERFTIVQKGLKSLKLDPTLAFGGVIDFNKGKNHLAFLLNTSDKLKLTPVSKSLTFLSTLGYRPDIVAVEHNIGFKLENYIDLFSIAPTQRVKGQEYTIDLLQKLHIDLFSEIEKNLKDNSTAAQFYFSFLKDLHPHLGPDNLSLKDLKAIQIIGNAYENLLDHLKTSVDDYAKFIEKIDLIFEEINLISKFNTSLNFETKLRSLAAIDEVPFNVTLHTSGMNVFSMLIPALHKALKDKNERFTALIPESLYFEVKTKIAHLQKCMIASAYTSDFNPEKADVVFVELHPNDVTKNYMRDLEVIKNINKEKLNARKVPLTVVLDSSTTLFYDKDIKDIIKHFPDEIEAGKIAFVVINSLEKLFQFGQSKYPGGLCAIYASEEHSSLQEVMAEYAKKEPYSREAQSFLKMFVFHEKWPLLYKSLILKNTEYFYEKISQRLTGFEGDSFEVIKKESYKTPFLALHYQTFVDKILRQLKSNSLSHDETNRVKECTAKVISQFCGVLANLENLFLPRRMSFGFSHINFLDCYTALRLSIGLEPEEVLDQFLELFTKLDQSLQVDSSQLKGYANLIHTIISQDDYEEILQNVIKGEVPKEIKKVYDNDDNPQKTFIAFLNYLGVTTGLQPEKSQNDEVTERRTSNFERVRGRGRGENAMTSGRGSDMASRGNYEQSRGRGRGGDAIVNTRGRGSDMASRGNYEPSRGRGRGGENAPAQRGRGRTYDNSSTRGTRGNYRSRGSDNFYRN